MTVFKFIDEIIHGLVLYNIFEILLNLKKTKHLTCGFVVQAFFNYQFLVFVFLVNHS